MSDDHKPNNPGERSRIVAAGGYIETQASSSGTQYRVNGNLNLSRALGDLEYKKDRRRLPEQQIISGTPDVSITERTPEDEFLLICCDGVWDMKSNLEAVDFVRRRLPKDPGADPHLMVKVMDELLDDCLSPDLKRTKGLGGDNMTAVIVIFPPPAAQGSAQLVDVQCQTRTATSGDLRVKLLLPEGCNGGDLRFDVCARTAEIEVFVAGGPARRFSLRKELPSGAELVPGNEEAKFHKKSSTVRCRIPWWIPLPPAPHASRRRPLDSGRAIEALERS